MVGTKADSKWQLLLDAKKERFSRGETLFFS